VSGATITVADKADNATAKTVDLASKVGKLFRGDLTSLGVLAKPLGPLRLYFDDTTVQDLWIAVTWTP
jgi:hypothetical protein